MTASDAHLIATPDVLLAYHRGGPDDGVPVLLTHGFPDDPSTWDAVAPHLHAAGFRTFAPYTRGFGETRIRPGAERTGEVAALAADVLAFADALGVERFAVVGHDWGARAAYAV